VIIKQLILCLVFYMGVVTAGGHDEEDSWLDRVSGDSPVRSASGLPAWDPAERGDSYCLPVEGVWTYDMLPPWALEADLARAGGGAEPLSGARAAPDAWRKGEDILPLFSLQDGTGSADEEEADEEDAGRVAAKQAEKRPGAFLDTEGGRAKKKAPRGKVRLPSLLTEEINNALRAAASQKAPADDAEESGGKLTIQEAASVLVALGLITEDDAQKSNFPKTPWYRPVYNLLNKEQLLEKRRVSCSPLTSEMQQVLSEAAQLASTGKLTLDQARTVLVQKGFKTPSEVQKKTFSEMLYRFLKTEDRWEGSRTSVVTDPMRQALKEAAKW
jgi:hypothetical protein